MEHNTALLGTVLVAGRVVERVAGHHGPGVQVGGQHEGVPLHPEHRRRSLGLAAAQQLPEVVLRLVKLTREVSVQINTC